MLMIALTAKEFNQSPYEYLVGSQLKLAVDMLCYNLIVEAKSQAYDEAGLNDI